jgi:hypothetical protein
MTGQFDPTGGYGPGAKRPPASKTVQTIEWVMEFHEITGGVWPTPGQVVQHAPCKPGRRTASRAIEHVLEMKHGANCANEPSNSH